MTRNVEAIWRLFRIPHNGAPTTLEPLMAIFPGHMAPIVRRAEDGERELVIMSWLRVSTERRGAATGHECPR